MQEKTDQEKIAANRQVRLLTEALEQSRQKGGVWLNEDGKKMPTLHRKEVGVSGFNSLILGLNSDANRYQTNLYTFYSDARNLKSPVRDHERGVPFNWYNWSKYENKNNPNDVISREDYLQLPIDQQAQYKGVRHREVRWLFNIDQTIIPFSEPERYAQLVERNGSAEARKAPDYDNDKVLRVAVNDFLLKMRDNLVDIMHDGADQTYYDTDKNIIHLANQNSFASYPQFVQELMRNVAAATGHQQRLAREGMVAQGGIAPSEDAVKQEKLVQEIVSGIKMQELGLPAKLSNVSNETLDYWIRELKENPRLIDIVERDVNSALNIIKRAERGEKIEMATKINADKTEQYRDALPKHFYIADDIKLYPDKDQKFFVVVKDVHTKTADVVLPQGASVERNNEVPGMNKDRITKALEKQGFDTVRFYNPDGALGYRPDDSSFVGKEVFVSKLKNWEMEDISKLDISQAVELAGQIEFDRVQMIQDDNNRWALFVKPEGRDSFTVYPEKADINRFFTTLKQSQASIDDVRVELGNKYFAMTEANPELKVDIFGSGQNAEVDLNRIQKVSLFKTKSDVVLCAATIEGVGRLEPKVISPQQWQRLWLAEDREAYKRNLAANLYADVLQQTKSTHQAVEDKPKVESSGLNAGEYDVPEWALSYLENGDASGLEDKEIEVADKFIKDNFPNGFTMKVNFDNPNEFNNSPAFGLRRDVENLHGESPFVAVKTYPVAFYVQKQQEEKKPEPVKVEKEQEKQNEQKKQEEDKRPKLPWTWNDLKKRHPDAMLMFRSGDFYSLYKEDAKKAADTLGITLFKGQKDVDMAQFPYHALDTYLPKLIRSGFRVAICDQLREPTKEEAARVEREQKAETEEHRSSGLKR